MKLDNRSTLLKTKEIQQCVNLLNKKYRKIQGDITFYKDEETLGQKQKASLLLGGLVLGNYNAYLNTKPDGTYVIDNNTAEVSIYEFNIKGTHTDEEFIKINMIGALFHEMRHAYQALIKPSKFFENDVPYHKRWIERDAAAFSENMMYKHKNKINNILGIKKSNWRFNSLNNSITLESQ